MANYNLVTTGTFQPFTYDELSAPISAKEKEHEASELAAMTLQEQIADLQGVDLGSDERNIMLNDFKRSLDNVYNQLGESGITPELSRTLQGIKRDYARDILPIIKKIDKLNLAEENRSKWMSENPNIIFKHSLPTIGEVIDGAKIDQGFWDTSKLTLSVEDRVTPVLANILARDKNLGDITKYDDILTNLKNELRNSESLSMPENFDVDSIVNNIFNNLHMQEYSRRAQKEAIEYEKRHRGSRIYNSRNNNNVNVNVGSLKPYDSNGELNEGWALDDDGKLTITDEKLRNAVHEYVLKNAKDAILYPYIDWYGYKIPNSNNFEFNESGHKPKDSDAYRKKLLSEYTPNRTGMLGFSGSSPEYTVNHIEKVPDGAEVVTANDVRHIPALINWLRNHEEAELYRYKEGDGTFRYITRYSNRRQI